MFHIVISVLADHVDKTDQVCINMQHRECGDGGKDCCGAEQSGTLANYYFIFT